MDKALFLIRPLKLYLSFFYKPFLKFMQCFKDSSVDGKLKEGSNKILFCLFAFCGKSDSRQG
jgi:hypothetical protein